MFCKAERTALLMQRSAGVSRDEATQGESTRNLHRFSTGRIADAAQTRWGASCERFEYGVR